MKDNIICRAANVADNNRLKALFQEVLSIHCEMRPDVFRVKNDAADELFLRMVRDPHRLCLVAAAGAEVVGYVLYSIQLFHRHPVTVETGWATIEHLYVRNDWRRRGIGRALLEASEKPLAERGVETVDLQVWAGNPQAEAFYRQMGYRRRSTILEKNIEIA